MIGSKKIIQYFANIFPEGALRFNNLGSDRVEVVDVNNNSMVCRYFKRDDGLSGINEYIEVKYNGGGSEQICLSR